MQESKNTGVIRNERTLPFSPRQVFSAFEKSDRVALWWGPKDFTNTFESFEFKVGAKWVFTMHAPNGANYPSENILREIQTDRKIIIEHIDAPWYRLTVTLSPESNGTHLIWNQEFESPAFAEKMRALCEPANEQNLDRLQAFLERHR